MMQLKLLTWQFSVEIERVRTTTTELVTAYNHIAPVWDDKVRRLGFDRAYRHLFTELDRAGLLPKPARDRVSLLALDCGIGTGALSVALSQTVNQRIWFHGIDVSSEMVALARRRLLAQGIYASIEARDVRELPYDADHFPLVISAHTLEHLADPQEGLWEMVRVLQPGGRLLLVMTCRSLIGSLLDTKWGLNCVEPDTLRQWLTAAGLEDIQFHTLGGPFWCRRMSLACTACKPLRM